MLTKLENGGCQELWSVWDFIPPAHQHLSLPPFLGCWRKTWDSWVRDRGLYYSWHCKWHELHVHIRSPCLPGSPRTTQRTPGRCCAGGRNASQVWILSWETLNLLSLLVSTHLPVALEGDIISTSQGCLLDERLWKDHEEQGPSVPLLPRYAKCKASLENSLPVVVQGSILTFASQSPKTSAELPRAGGERCCPDTGRGKTCKSKGHPLVPCPSSKKSLDVFCFSALPKCWASR